MTTQRLNPSAQAYPFVLTLLGAALIGALYVSLQARELKAQEVFGVDTEFDDV